MAISNNIDIIKKKLQIEIKTKKKELADLEGKMSSIDQVLDLLVADSADIIVESMIHDPIENKKGKFDEVGTKESIKILINDFPTRAWSVREVRDYLLRMGFVPRTKHFYTVISTTLDRLARDGFVKLEQTDSGKRFQLIEHSPDEYLLKN